MAAPKKAAKDQPVEGANGSIAEFSKEQELSALRDMLLIRRFEEKAGQLYGMGAIGGFCHLYIGQEAVVVGMQMALKQGDEVTLEVDGSTTPAYGTVDTVGLVATSTSGVAPRFLTCA